MEDRIRDQIGVREREVDKKQRIGGKGKERVREKRKQDKEGKKRR